MILTALLCGLFAIGQGSSPASEVKSQSPTSPSEQQQLPPAENTFGKSGTNTTPGSAIPKGAEAAVASRRRNLGALDILSDAQGVDFGPYLQRVLLEVRDYWYAAIPQSAQTGRGGKLAIEFAISRNGRVADVRLVAASGDPELDRAAWGSITASSPFKPLPDEFKGSSLALRLRFYYNPENSDLPEDTIKHAVLIKKLADSNLPEYPKNALDAKVEGLVRLEGVVGADGRFEELRVVEGDKDLAAGATSAISKWRFRPAKKNGKHIQEPVRINVLFRLDGEQVHTQVFNAEGELK
jgi:TonB family protein